MASILNVPIPAHVPMNLVFDFDFLNLANPTDDPFEHYAQLLRAGAPPIFYSLKNGGHWVFCRHEEIFEGYRDWEMFSSSPQGIPNRPGGPARMIPNEIDPPEHQRVRAILAPQFSPAAIHAIKHNIRARSARLIDVFATSGRCEYMADFAARLPTGIFLDLMGLPEDQLPQFMIWEDMAMRSTDPEKKGRGFNLIYAYLNQFIDDKLHHLGDDVASAMLRYRDANGKGLTQEEVVSACNLLYLAGLDTVMNTLGITYRYLARNAAARQTIGAHPERLPAMVDEFLRVFGTPALARRVRKDMVFHGIAMKAGDPVLLPTMLANRDIAVYVDPETVQLDREPKQVLTFGAGPHRCLGAHLAKTELIIAIEEWFKRIPEFAIDEREQISYVTGHTVGIHNLPLVWDV